MNITLISLDNWGFNRRISDTLREKGHTVTYIDFHKFKYTYPSFFHRIYNYFLKTFVKRNLKMEFYGRKIIEQLQQNNEIQDLIITIKGDHIDSESIRDFKKYTKKSIAFFNDSIGRCPKIVRVIPAFDEVYSFEKDDCKNYNLKFITNFIYDNILSDPAPKSFDYKVFNISSKDRRTPTIVKIAQVLKQKGLLSKIIILDTKNSLQNAIGIELIQKPIPLEKVNEYIDKSLVLLDIQRDKQQGLTFRVFESLGKQKKLITTNQDIVNYDFYNPNNILVIDETNVSIPLSFFETEYQEIPQEIIKKYTLEGWTTVILQQETI